MHLTWPEEGSVHAVSKQGFQSSQVHGRAKPSLRGVSYVTYAICDAPWIPRRAVHWASICMDMSFLTTTQKSLTVCIVVITGQSSAPSVPDPDLIRNSDEADFPGGVLQRFRVMRPLVERVLEG